jgi:small-conductance mechanosensitive channel
VLLIFLSFSYFTGNIKDFTLAIGLFSAGIAFTLQELILSIAGSVYIFVVKVYKPGDRIEINGIKGDVIDVDSIYTTMMEIGQWVSSDNYTGRIVKLSNAFVFKGPIYNYSQDFPFIWDEFNLKNVFLLILIKKAKSKFGFFRLIAFNLKVILPLHFFIFYSFRI